MSNHSPCTVLIARQAALSMRLLILWDIHGNWPALEAVLAAEPARDAVVFCGDVVDYGPQPLECLHWLAENADMLSAGTTTTPSHSTWTAGAWALSEIFGGDARLAPRFAEPDGY